MYDVSRKKSDEGDRELIAFRIGDQEFCVNVMSGARDPRLDAGNAHAALRLPT
jgi:hypothetical protein